MSEKTYKISPWNLDALFTGIKSEDVSQTLQRVEENTGKFETYREKLSPEMDIEDFYEAITLSEKIYLDVAKLSQYAFLKFSSNTQDTEAMTFMGKMDQINAEVQNRLLFFSLWWKGLEEDEAQKFMVRAGEYEYYLKQLRNFKPYTLGEAEEKIINLKNVTGSSAIKSVYEAITNRLTFKLTIEGEEKELTQSELLQKDAHQAINEGASVDEICEIYYKNLQEQFGDPVELYDEFKWEWVYVAHFYDRPFYVYAYAFGQLLVFALYQQFKQEGRSFIPRFMTILSDGGSMSPIDILDKAGVDIRTSEFWQGGFDVISEMVDQLEQIPVG